MDRITGDESELNAGGPTGRRSRDLFRFRPSRPPDHRTYRFYNDGSAGIFRLLVARQPERLSLRSASSNHDEGPTPSTSGNGTIGNKTNRNRDRDVDRLRTLLPPVPDHHFIATTKH